MTPSANKADFQARWGRLLCMVSAGLFLISTVFPVIAGILPGNLVPQWVGFLDVASALAPVIMAIIIYSITNGKTGNQVVQISYQIYRMLASLLLVLLVVFFIFGDQIRWNVLLPGLAWRAWLLFYTLPAWLTVWEKSGVSGDNNADVNISRND